MNWDRIERNWKQFQRRAKAKWDRLTDDQLEVTGGDRDKLAAKIRAAYGISEDEVEQQLFDWQRVQKVREPQDLH